MSSEYSNITMKDIVTSSVSVCDYIERYRLLPPSVKVGEYNLTTSQFLFLASKVVVSLHNGIQSSSYAVPYNLKEPDNPYATMSLDVGAYDKQPTEDEYVRFLKSVPSFLVNGTPDIFETTFGMMRYSDVVYFAASILRFYSFFGYLPTFTEVKIASLRGLTPFPIPEGLDEWTSSLTLSPFAPPRYYGIGSMTFDMVKLALQITQGSSSVTEAARRIRDWVMDRWLYSFSVGYIFCDLSDGSPIAASMFELANWFRSTCTTTPTIIGSLLRSAGIPTRFRRGTWVDFYDGEKWVPISAHSPFGTLWREFPGGGETGNEPIMESGPSPSLDDPNIQRILATMSNERYRQMAKNMRSMIWLTPSTLNEDNFRETLATVISGGYDSIILFVKDSLGNLYYNTSYVKLRKYDALAEVLTEAHRSGIKVYAALNVFCDRRYVEENPGSAQIRYLPYNKASYDFVSPTEARYNNFIRIVLKEILNRYPVDGIVLLDLGWEQYGGQENSTVRAFESETGLSFGDQRERYFVDFENWKDNYIGNLTSSLTTFIKSLASVPVFYASRFFQFTGEELNRIAKEVDYVIPIYTAPRPDLPGGPIPDLLRTEVRAVPNIIPLFPIVDEWPYPPEYYYYLKGYLWEQGIHSVAFHPSNTDVNAYYSKAVIQILSKMNRPPPCAISLDVEPRVGYLIVDNTLFNSSEIPLSLRMPEGSTHSLEVESTVESGLGVRYLFEGWSDGVSANPRNFTVLSQLTLVARYKRQFYLTVISPYGNPIGEGWYDAGERATFSISPIIDYGNYTRRVFVGWSGDVMSNSSTATLLVDSPKTIVARWKTQYYLNIVSSYGEIQGGGWYDAGSTVKISIPPIIDHGNGTRRVFVKWSGDVVVSTTNGSVVMDSPKSVKAEWKTQYYLTVLSEYGEVEGSGWYDEGTMATISVAKTVVSSGNIFFNEVFKGWRDQTGTIVSTQPTYTFAVNTPRSLTAVWENQLNIIPTIVIAIIVASGIICVVLYIFLRRTKEAPPPPPLTS